VIHTARQSPKFIKLKRRLRGIVPEGPFTDPESVAIAILERLWHATASGPIRGDIGSFDDEVIAEACGWPLEASLLIDLLVECGWLDRHPTHRLLVHDWHQHAPNHVKGNVAKKGGFLTYRDGDAPAAEPKGEPKGPAPEVEPQRTSAPNLTKPNPTTVGRMSTACDSTDEAATAADSSLTEVPPPDPERAYRFGVAIGPARQRADSITCWKLVALEAILGEAWLANIKSAVREVRPPPEKPWAYAMTVAAKGSRERPGPGRDRLHRLMAMAPEPPPDWPRSLAPRKEATTA
jgi:hypothetical protein